MTADITIRPMTDADRPAVLDMWVATWKAAYPDIDFDARRGWAGNHFAELERSGSQFFVAEVGGKVVGLVSIDPATGYLDQFAVATRLQGQGIGDRLLAQAKALTPRLELRVNTDNARAIAFYKKHGFTVAGESTNATGAPIYLMRWEQHDGQKSEIILCLLPLIESGRAGLLADALAADIIAADARLNIYCLNQKRNQHSEDAWLQLLDLYDELTKECRASVRKFSQDRDYMQLQDSLGRIASKLKRLRFGELKD